MPPWTIVGAIVMCVQACACRARPAWGNDSQISSILAGSRNIAPISSGSDMPATKRRHASCTLAGRPERREAPDDCSRGDEGVVGM